MKEVFGQSKFTIISQPFHNERAIYLAEKEGIDAIAYNAKDVNGTFTLRVKIREYLAKTKAVLDVLIGKEPKFLGEKVLIN